MSNPVQGRWVSMRAAAELAGVPMHRIRRLAELGVITTFQLPRTRPVVDRAEVEKLAKDSVRPATITA